MNNPGDNQSNTNLRSLRDDVTATTDVLKVTVDKLVQRGENLDAINHRAEELDERSYYFRGTARRVNRQMRWQNWKLTFFIILVVIAVIAFIILMAIHPWKK